MKDNITIDDLVKLEDYFYRSRVAGRAVDITEINDIGERYNLNYHDLRYIGSSFHRGLRHSLKVLARYDMQLELKVKETEEVGNQDIQTKVIQYLRSPDIETFIWLMRHASFDELKDYMGQSVTDIEVYRWIMQYRDFRYLYFMSNEVVSKGLRNINRKTTLSRLIYSESTDVFIDVLNTLKGVYAQTDYQSGHVLSNLYKITYIHWMLGSVHLQTKCHKYLFETGFRRGDFYFAKLDVLLDDSGLIYLEDMMVKYFNYNKYGIQLLLNARQPMKTKYKNLYKILDKHYNYLRDRGLIEDDYLTQEVDKKQHDGFFRYLGDLRDEYINTKRV